MARRLDDPSCLGRVLGVAGFALWEPENLPERLEIAVELIGLAEQLGDPVLEIEGGIALYYAAAQQGDIARARDALAMATRAAAEIGQPAPRLRALVGQQNSAMVDGRCRGLLPVRRPSPSTSPRRSGAARGRSTTTGTAASSA